MDATTALSWLIALPIVAAPAIYILGRLDARRKAAPLAARVFALLTLAVMGAPLFFAGKAVLAGETPQLELGQIALRMDGVGLLLAATAWLLTLVVLVFSLPYMAGETGEEKYYALVPVLAAAIIGLGCAADLFNLWVWFEAMAISTYLLVAFYRTRSSLEAGVKYLVQSASGSALVLLGIALVFSQTGVLDLAQIRQTPLNPALYAAGALFVIGYGVKSALVPLHTWLPDAHSQAPSGISALLSGIVIEAGLVALLRSLGALSGGAAAQTWGHLLLAFGALNMLVGNLMALRQEQVKRLLAYSSLGHIGYMLVGFGAAAAYGASNSAGGAFFHLFSHALMKGLAFLAAGQLLYALYVGRGKHDPLTLADLNGASKRYPLAALAFSLAVLSLGGLPPLVGFMSKWQIFLGGAETREPVMLWLVGFAALNSVLSLGYYAPMVNRLYRGQPSEAAAAGLPANAAISATLIFLSLAVIALGLWPGVMDQLTLPAARSFLAMFGL